MTREFFADIHWLRATNLARRKNMGNAEEVHIISSPQKDRENPYVC